MVAGRRSGSVVFAHHPELIFSYENDQAKIVFLLNLGTKPSFWFVNEGCECEFGEDHFQVCSLQRISVLQQVRKTLRQYQV